MIKIDMRNLAEPEAVARVACEKTKAMAQRFPAIVTCRLELESLERDTGFEAHVELLLPQHQIIVNRDHRDPKGALETAFQAARHELDLLARRDRRFAAAETTTALVAG